ncbi:MAG: RsmD family RNA methyltransferase [Treponema sp.]|jgi:16S rRNA (guanine(966)-N(2))-methyltransferase RsmD|nr:RsmD family RNA methyltransferase [Treponema sp.]
MRITGGAIKGRQVEVPAGIIRPAMDRMRESVFAVLGDLNGLSFLDIFSGSGIIALEAASRGAGPVDAVEADPRKRKTLLKNVSIAPVRIECHFITAELFVQRSKKHFDLIFCDPPFPYRYKWELLQSIAASALAGPGSRLLLHRPREDSQRDLIEGGIPGKLARSGAKVYGRSVVDFFTFTVSNENKQDADDTAPITP